MSIISWDGTNRPPSFLGAWGHLLPYGGYLLIKSPGTLIIYVHFFCVYTSYSCSNLNNLYACTLALVRARIQCTAVRPHPRLGQGSQRHVRNCLNAHLYLWKPPGLQQKTPVHMQEELRCTYCNCVFYVTYILLHLCVLQRGNKHLGKADKAEREEHLTQKIK